MDDGEGGKTPVHMGSHGIGVSRLLGAIMSLSNGSSLIMLAFGGTSAVFFAAINLAKWPPYAWLGLIDWRNMATSLALLPLAPLGVWLGVKLTPHVPQAL